MRSQGWTIARIRGIPLRLHYSLILLLLYVVLVGSLQLPLVARQAGIDITALSGSPFAWGVIFAIGLFVSVTLHEFGHALVARTMNIRVRSVTLMMLGGYSDMEKMPERPLQEFKLAVIGPLVSLAIGFVLLFARQRTGSVDLEMLFYWLGSANLVLGIFNLLPAFPLDGGRALRSILAARQGNLRGTTHAVQVSKVLAWALGLFGFIQLNILMVAIAFFVYAAAESELVVLMGRELLQGMKVSEVIRRADPVQESQSLQSAASEMVRSSNSVLPVETGNGTPAVIDLQTISRLKPELRQRLHVKDVMVVPDHAVRPEENLAPIFQEIASSPAHALPVMEQGHLAGVVRLSDVREAMELKSLDVDKKAG